MRQYNQWVASIGALVLTVVTVAPLWALVPADRSAGIGQRAFQHPDLKISHAFQPASRLPSRAAAVARQQLAALGLSDQQGQLDVRSGRWATLLFSHPLLPGSAMGNHLQWPSGAPRSAAAHRQAAWHAFYAFLRAHAAQLGIDLNELRQPGKVTIQAGGDLVQIHARRISNGIPVRDSYLTATLNHGNLVLFATRNWGTLEISTQPEMSQADALASLQAYLDTFIPNRFWGRAELNIVPMAQGPDPNRVAIGQGYAYRLVWVLRPAFAGDLGRWEALVDADSGEVLSLVDTNEYAEAKGGAYPVTNDGVVPDGVEQAGWPMPYLDVGVGVTDTGGNAAASGSMTASLTGPYIRMSDTCGPISLSQSDILDFGTSGGTDCSTPGFGGDGNTHASRTGFYELNKIKEMARGQLPSNTWLQQQLTANMNLNQTCNAFWGSGTVNFYRSGSGCSNTGEIAGVFDHEWGHGMDANDATPGIASPSGEGIADIYAALRLNDSCIGRNFRDTVCDGFGDPCLSCTGVRDIDYLQRQSGQPHDYSWSNANCSGSVHCIGGVYAEAVWSLWKRQLQSPPYNMDDNTAHEVVTRLTFLGAGNTATWFSGGPPHGGCGGDSGYLNFLVADDDNGDLNDGTPHMTAIFNAFNDQEIACQTPTVQDSGCANTPTAVPSVNTGNGNRLVTLNWNTVPNATKYQVFRTEGVFECDFGKVKLGETTGTSWNDSGLQNGRDYSYVVIPIGTADSCMGAASACATDSPVGMPDFAVSCSPADPVIAQNDTASSICTVASSFGYTGNVSLSCQGNPAGIACAFSPASVSPPADGSAATTLTLSVDPAQAVGDFSFDIVADDGAINRTSAISVQVIPEGQNGPQNAVYNMALGAPACAIAGSACDSGALPDGRAALGPESNQPNTLDTCTDGTSGTYHYDESNDRIVVRTLDGYDFTAGATVEVEATVWAWSTGDSDTLDLYYAADASNPIWVPIASLVPPGGGLQTLSAQYTLPGGGLQAVRANFRYTGVQSPCSTGTYDDHDDLIFAVNTTVPEHSGCSTDLDCDDNVGCTVDACNLETGLCVNSPNNTACNDGWFCNGVETCDPVLDCQPGTPPCDDGVVCTDDTCDEGTDSCSHTPDDGACSNGLFCDGVETCDPVLDCQPGTPVVCDDGIGCTDDTCAEGANGYSCDSVPNDANCDDGVGCTVDICNTETTSCDHIADDAWCDNGLFCDGTETCNAVSDCQAGSAPCPGGFCDETGDTCLSCIPKGASCSADGDCCSNKCRGKAGSKTCK